MIEFGKDKFKNLKILSDETEGIFNVSGITESTSAFVAAVILNERKRNCLILMRSYEKAKKFAQDIAAFYEGNVHVLPEEQFGGVSYEAKSRWMIEERFVAANDFLKGAGCIVIAPVMTAMTRMLSPDSFIKNIFTLEVGSEIDLEAFKRAIPEMGYERTNVTESKGKYSIRGDIIDVFPADAELPYRIELFDTSVDCIRTYDPVTQRSVENVSKVEVFPAGTSQRFQGDSFLWDYLERGDMIVLDDYDRITGMIELSIREYYDRLSKLSDANFTVDRGQCVFGESVDLIKALKKKLSIIITPFQSQLKEIDRIDGILNIRASRSQVFNGRMDVFATELNSLFNKGYQTAIYCSTQEREKSIRDFLLQQKIETEVAVAVADLSAGTIFPEEKVAIFSDGDIFTIQRKSLRKRKTRRAGQPIRTFTEIKTGDLVVHEYHGIGRFSGVERLEIQGIKKDYLKIQYAGEDVLYIPVEQMDLIQSYIGGGGAKPKISKLNSGEWNKTKAKAKCAIETMAKELLELSAERNMQTGFAFSPDTTWQRDFESMFPYELTSDQWESIEAIKNEMETPVPMDHLLCGDVGYGKTEVAARAIFKCIMDGKQAAVLVPTTILANQHYLTFKDRFEKFPCSVDLLCRFRSEAQQDVTVDRLANGKVDLVVGTHRLLSNDVKFKDLGLLVIDEEQRFGVHHKEKLKQIKKNVDVLTLSATPIPRTLHMSLVGVRNMSMLTEPPEERFPVQTFVMEQNDSVIAEVIEREIAREGQVFVVYNRVRGIAAIGAYISRLVPDARVAVAHGQMREHELEDIMIAFVEREYDVLVATTIIESGIDIQNANTIIILDSDRYGLSQLYQLRGRVGRTDRMAYAYLMYRKDKVLTDIAEARLRAIKEFTEFGSGFRVAMRDLEIRGAGNLLGTDQSGHMATIGYELYCKLVDETVRRLRGLKTEEELPEILIEIDIDAYIPDKYISDEMLKLQMYKRIASIESRVDMSDVRDELIDRFGEIPDEADALIKVAYCKNLGQRLGVSKIYRDKQTAIFEFYPKNRVTTDGIIRLSTRYGLDLQVNQGRKPHLAIKLKSRAKLIDEMINFLEVLDDIAEAG